jgi:hypothetical protein
MRQHEFITETVNEKILVNLDVEKLTNIDNTIGYLRYIKDKLFNITNKESEEFKKYKGELKEYTSLLSTYKQDYIEYLDSFSPFIPQIKSECSYYLNIFKQTDSCLYSGRKLHGALYVDKSIENRKPMSSSNLAQIEFDDALKALNIEARRSNSIFTTSSFGHSSNYGYAKYVIIPKNTAVFSWSMLHDDLVLGTEKFIHLHEDSPFLNILKDELDEVTEEYHSAGSNVQISLHCYLYILRDFIKQNYRNKDSSIEYLKKHFPNSPVLKIADRFPKYDFVPAININKFQNEYKIINTNLDKAMETNHEILIHGEYYGIHLSVWPDLQEKLFGK